jgi:folate-binding protein YgfZ
MASVTTSFPIPSPGTTAILFFAGTAQNHSRFLFSVSSFPYRDLQKATETLSFDVGFLRVSVPPWRVLGKRCSPIPAATPAIRYNQTFDMSATSLNNKLPEAGRRVEDCGAQTPAGFSPPQEGLTALRARCGLFDLGWRAKLVVTGRDRTRWLNGMVTNNIRDLAPGHGVYSFLLNAQGHILGDMYVFNRGESFLIDTDRSQVEKLAQLLKKYIIMDQVVLSEAGQNLITALGLEGPNSKDVLARAGVEPGQLQPLEIEDGVWHDAAISLVGTMQGGYMIWLPPESACAMWEALAEAGASPVGAEALELWRIAAGIPRYGVDIRERDLPQETGQEHALNFSKGCYIGQEIVERIRSRGAVHRRFTGFSFAGPAPAAGTKIERDGRELGEITSVAALPSGQAVGLGYLRREAGGPGTTVEVGGVQATVSELPFNI